ncbi:MAG: peptidase M28 family protein, partial [Gramella sp.]|nr:peptidase M28 family protein [Christiangramia sp.]
MKSFFIAFILVITGISVQAQSNSIDDSLALRKIYDMSLLNGKSYEWLDHLSNEVGSRLSGSYGAEQAIAYTKNELEKLGLDKVWLQPVMVPKWTRGGREFAYVQTGPGETRTINITALGGSIATPEG